MVVPAGQPLAEKIVDMDSGGRLRAGADNRSQPRANCKKKNKNESRTVPVLYHTVPSSGTVPYSTVPYPDYAIIILH